MTCAQGLLRLLWGGPEVGVLRDWCRHVLDGTFALAWELPFPRCLATCLSHKGGDVPLGALAKDTTSELAGLFSTISL